MATLYLAQQTKLFVVKYSKSENGVEVSAIHGKNRTILKKWFIRTNET